ncbi:polysaccharide biosynthesis/export family protein [Aquimarina sp. ERC-38]|uniref:polysaccharide biosynthesis/export family protein n=1 Tax=Aquimarina sp. ERC-38 TaxID=2949996 RepID=UPI002248165E|nr:polysaccharide biosynthesis/export family protein [Aquimarina sp. ERC-38]UZO80229.1 polysaccharide biosynthesis/export family protein [Aquimarina sp. ERC-38]
MNLTKLLLTVISISAFISCNNSKEIIYFQDLNSSNSNLSKKIYVPVFQVGDLVSISVTALDMAAVAPFNPLQGMSNATTSDLQGNVAVSGYTPTQNNIPTYLIDSEGNIEFPVLGTIKLAGLDKIEAKAKLQEKLLVYVKDPIINIQTENFKVTVLGEVRKPGTYTIKNDRITVVEALGLAGDMTIKGRRKDVLVIREVDNVKKSYVLDMTSSSVFNSEVYYLSQNDVVYVKPNKSEIRRSNNNGRTASIIISLTAVILSGINLILRNN